MVVFFLVTCSLWGAPQGLIFLDVLAHNSVAPPSLPPSFGVFLCAVCVSVLNQVNESLAPADRKNQLKIEAAIDTFCGQRLSSRDDKMVREQNGLIKGASLMLPHTFVLFS